MKKCSRPKCKHGGKPQEKSNFYANRQLADGLCSHCKDCDKEDKGRKKLKKFEGNWLKLLIG